MKIETRPNDLLEEEHFKEPVKFYQKPRISKFVHFKYRYRKTGNKIRYCSLKPAKAGVGSAPSVVGCCNLYCDGDNDLTLCPCARNGDKSQIFLINSRIHGTWILESVDFLFITFLRHSIKKVIHKILPTKFG